MLSIHESGWTRPEDRRIEQTWRSPGDYLVKCTLQAFEYPLYLDAVNGAAWVAIPLRRYYQLGLAAREAPRRSACAQWWDWPRPA